MIVFLLIYTTIFPVLMGLIDGYHDLEIDIYRKTSGARAEDIKKIGRASGMWHTLGMIRSILIMLVLGFGMYEYTHSWWDTYLSCAFFTAMSALLQDSLISLIRGLPLDFYGTVDGKWDVSDKFWRILKDCGIPQMIVKIAFVVITGIVMLIWW